MTVYDLLDNEAEKLRKVIKTFKPKFGKEEYKKFWNKLLTKK